MSFLYGVFIAHFLPGFFLLLHIYKIGLFGPTIPWGLWACAFAVSSFMLGLIIDTIRYNFICGISSKTHITFENLSSDDVSVYEGILNHYFRYHQFAANMSIAFIVSSVVPFLSKPPIGVLYLAIAANLLYASVKLFRKSMERLMQRFGDA